MSSIVVSCGRWLGLSKRHVVRIDSREVGRLGWRNKQVTAEVGAGRHSVVVDYDGQTTPVESVEVGDADEVNLKLTFSWGEVAQRAPSWHPAERIAARDVTDYMTLVRIDRTRG